jgi:hypothetical protein
VVVVRVLCSSFDSLDKTRSRTKHKEQQQDNDKQHKPNQSTDYQQQDQRTLSNTKTPFLETKQKHNTRTIIKNTFNVVLVLSCVWFRVLCSELLVLGLVFC